MVSVEVLFRRPARPLLAEGRVQRGVPRVLSWALGLSLWASCAGEGGEVGTQEGAGDDLNPAPNVLLIVVDTLRKDHLSAYGYGRRTSPRLEELAEVSQRYESAIAQAPWTTPSIGALLSSRYPTSLGIRGEQNALADELVLLPEALKANGYQTAGVISHSFLGTAWNFDQGFDVFDEDNVQGHSAVTSMGVTAAARPVLRQLAADEEPFFLFVHYFDPHAAYVEHEAHDFGGADASYDGPIESGLLFRELRRMEETVSDSGLDELKRLYDSEIAFTDRAIGVLLDELRTSGELDETLVIVTADHGEEFLDHGKFGHAKSLFDELINVPLLIKPPLSMGIAPRVISEPVALIDLYPTILSAAGLTSQVNLDGEALLPAPPVGRTLFSETSRTRSSVAAIEGSLKLIQRPNGKVRLFDRSTDAAEKVNLVESRQGDVERILLALDAWRETAQRSEIAGERVELDVEEAKRMRELGYGGDD